ncbi:hypothetical protein KAT67_02670 [candidate division WOR-3 bacterium]|nr:hypothetical protein [candidate division WOR-3 bacterium]
MKNNNYNNLEKDIRAMMDKLLKAVPFIRLETTQEERISDYRRADLIFNIRGETGLTQLIVEVKSQGEPRIIRAAIQQLREYSRQYPNAYGVVGAPFITKDTAEICKENGIGYVDTASNCFLNFNGVYIERTNYPNPIIEKRTLRSIFSNKASRIIRVMLCNPRKIWRIQEMAREANVSIGLAYKVKERLLDLEYAQKDRGGIIILRPQRLLDEWRSIYTFRKNKMYDFFGIKTVKEIERDIADYCLKRKVNYAFTLFSGAAFVAPYTKYTRGFVYITNDPTEIMKSLDLKTVDSGANLTILEPYDEGVFYASQIIQNINIVSDVQLYLDLAGYKGRGEDAAQFLFEQKLKPQW